MEPGNIFNLSKHRFGVTLAGLAAVSVAVTLSATCQDAQSQETVENSAAESAGVVDPKTVLLDSLRTEGMAALRSLWEDLGFRSETIFSELADSASLIVDQHAIQLDGVDASETLLRITDESQDDFHFLAMSRQDEQWISHGKVNLWNQRQTKPSYRMEVLGDDHRWFVVRSLGGSGAGFEQSLETWYWPTGSAMVSVLNFPLEGQVTGHGLPFDRTFTGRLQSIADEGGTPIVKVNITANYTSNNDVLAIDGVGALFSRNELVQYVFEDDTFTIDEENSTMTDVEVKGLFADDSNGFLKHNFEQLRTLAETGDEPKQIWLRRFLETQPDSTEKSTLEAALAARDVSTADAVGGE